MAGREQIRNVTEQGGGLGGAAELLPNSPL